MMQSEILTGVAQLQKRQTKLSLMGFLSVAVFVISFVSIFVHQNIVYSYMGMTLNVEQLHLPYSIAHLVEDFGHQSDYFMNLLSWLGWLILKVFSSIIGAFFALHILKKIPFFYVRFQSFVLKFVAWLIAIILIWSGLTYVQYDLSDDAAEQQFELADYKQSIQESQIARIMKAEQVNPTVQAYVLAQTALLHKPEDKDVATAYVAQLAQAERNQSTFIEYGFKPEQIWTMQHQLYGRSLTPMAKSLDSRAVQAQQISDFLQIALIVISVFMLFLMTIFFTLSKSFRRRIEKIQFQLSQKN